MPIQLNEQNGGKLVKADNECFVTGFERLARQHGMAMFSMPFVLGFLMLTQIGCTSVMPQPSASFAIKVPAAWSASTGAVQTGTSSLAQWWLRFNDPLLGSLVARAIRPTPA